MSISEEKTNNPVILFDGYCSLCSGSVVFILKREKKDLFRFASLQSEAGKQLIKKFTDNTEEDSVILIENKKIFTKSLAALRIAKRLKFPWNLSYVFIIIPPFIRNYFYDLIARNRKKWFGSRSTCYFPEKNMSYKFLE
jgi:predicted DCC family thiol-disulfide oxidoreductase YuxK